jgi:hypothetical protein
MPRMLSGAGHIPIGRALDLRILSCAPDAFTNCCIASCTVDKSSVDVRKMVTSSAYVTMETGSESCPIRTPESLCFSMVRKGSRHRLYKVILSGHPCRTPRLIGIGPCRCPLICTYEVVSVYKCCRRVTLLAEAITTENCKQILI